MFSTPITRALALILSALLFTACGSDPAPVPATLDPAAVDRAGVGLLASVLAFDVAETLGGLDTLVPASPTATVGANINGRSTRLVGTCGMVERDGEAVRVTVVAAGCVVTQPDPPVDPPLQFVPPAGMTAGVVTFTATRPVADLVIAVRFENVVARGVSLNGTVTLTTADVVTWSAAIDLQTTQPTDAQIIGTLELTLAGTSRTIEGELAVARGATTTAMFANVMWARGGCFPGAGTFMFGAAGSETLGSFDATTATSGAFLVTFAMVDSPATLPAYGVCPAP